MSSAPGIENKLETSHTVKRKAHDVAVALDAQTSANAAANDTSPSGVSSRDVWDHSDRWGADAPGY